MKKSMDRAVFKLVELSETMMDRYPKTGSPLTAEDRGAFLDAVSGFSGSGRVKARLTAGETQKACDALIALLSFR